MKIALISHLYPAKGNPANGTFIHEQALELRKHGQVDVLVPTVRAIPFSARYKQSHSALIDENNAKRVRYVSFPRKKLPGFIRRNLVARLVPLLEKQSYDIVHINWAYPDSLIIPELKNRGIPTLLHIHGSDWYKTRHPKSLRESVRKSLFDADRILVVGHLLQKDIGSAYPELTNKIFVHHNAVDTQLFTLPEDKTIAKKKLNWDIKKRHVLTVANVRYEKGIDVLIKAIQPQPLSDLHFHIIGNAYNDEYHRVIMSLIQQYEAPVTIYPPVAHHELNPFFQAADLFVLPSRKEGFGLALAEAGAAGLPLISTKSGGPEDIINSTNGLLVTADSHEELSEAMVYMIEHRHKYNAARIREDISSRFDKEMAAKRLLNHYQFLRQ